METFTKDDTVLLLVDHQATLMEQMVKWPPVGDITYNLVKLAEAARQLDVPVVITSNAEDNPYLGPYLPDVEPVLPMAYADRIQRSGQVDALADPRGADAVRATGRPNLVTAGVGTDVCGMQTALHARREGYRVQFVADATGTGSELAHDIALRRLEQDGVALTTTAGVVAELLQDGGRLAQIFMS